MRKIIDFFSFYIRSWVVILIKIYQKTLSFDHGPLKFLYPKGFCRFNPTCSQYGIDAINKFGVFKGGFMAFYRVLRCNPWSKGGNDPVSSENK